MQIIPKKIRFISSVIAMISIAYTAKAETHIVKVVSDYQTVRMYFDPKEIRIKKGDTVRWINMQKEKHNVVTYPDGYPAGTEKFSSPYFDQVGQEWSHTFTKSGTYEYHCHPHALMGMRGVVIVDRPSKPEEMHKPSEEELHEYRRTMLKIFDPDEFEFVPHYVRKKLDDQKK